MLKRLQEKKPNYNVTDWAADDHKRAALLKNICEYPYMLRGQMTQGQLPPYGETGMAAGREQYDFRITNQKKNSRSYSN